MKAWKLLTRLHSTSQSKKQLHLDIWASRSRDPADGPHQSFSKKSPTREMTPNSGPRGASVNDGIEKELCSLKYRIRSIRRRSRIDDSSRPRSLQYKTVYCSYTPNRVYLAPLGAPSALATPVTP